MENSDINHYLPLTEPAYFTMLALVEPSHGYAIMQQAKTLSAGLVKLGPGTLYGILAYLEKEKLIIKIKEERRRKVYTLTLMGKKVLEQQMKRYGLMAQQGEQLLRHQDGDLEEA